MATTKKTTKTIQAEQEANSDMQAIKPPLNDLIPPKEDFYKDLYELLKDNAKWVEQVKMSLLVLTHLYESFEKIELSYSTSLKECKKYAEQVKEDYERIKALSEAINNHYKELQIKAEEFENRINEQEQRITGIKEDCEYLKHEMEVYYTEIENFRVKIEIFKEEFSEKEQELLRTLEDFKQELQAKKADLEKLINDANADLNGFKSQIALEKTAFETLANETKNEISTFKTELSTKKEEILQEIENKGAEQKDFLKDFAKDNLGSLYAHIFSIERVLLEKGVVNLGEMQPLPLREGV